jgi:hypothetical protein
LLSSTFAPKDNNQYERGGESKPADHHDRQKMITASLAVIPGCVYMREGATTRKAAGRSCAKRCKPATPEEKLFHCDWGLDTNKKFHQLSRLLTGTCSIDNYKIL